MIIACERVVSRYIYFKRLKPLASQLLWIVPHFETSTVGWWKLVGRWPRPRRCRAGNTNLMHDAGGEWRHAHKGFSVNSHGSGSYCESCCRVAVSVPRGQFEPPELESSLIRCEQTPGAQVISLRRGSGLAFRPEATRQRQQTLVWPRINPTYIIAH